MAGKDDTVPAPYVRWLKGYALGEFILSMLIGCELGCPLRKNVRLSILAAKLAR